MDHRPEHLSLSQAGSQSHGGASDWRVGAGFLKRSKLGIEERLKDEDDPDVTTIHQAKQQRITASIPSSSELNLLRTHSPHPPGYWSRDLLAQQMCSLELSSDLSYAAARLYDSMHHLDLRYDLVDTSSPAWDDTATNSYTLPHYRRVIDAISWTTDITEIEDPFTHTLSKLLPSRSQTRSFGTVLAKEMNYERAESMPQRMEAKPSAKELNKEAKEDAKVNASRMLSRRIKHLTMTSLLGNYLHVENPESRPIGEERNMIQTILKFEKNNYNNWFTRILHDCPLLVKFCLRDFLIFSLLDSPALLNRLHSFIRFDHFQHVVSKATDAIRLYFKEHIAIPYSSLAMSLEHNGQLNHHWMVELSDQLEVFEAEMNSALYGKPKTNITTFLSGKKVRAAAPLVNRPLTSTEQEQMTVQQQPPTLEQEDEIDDLRINNVIAGDNTDRYSLKFNSIISDIRKNVTEKQNIHKAKQRDYLASMFILRFISQQQYTMLESLIHILVHRSNWCILQRVVAWFGFFNVPDSMIQFIQQIIECHQQGSVTLDNRISMLVYVQQHNPHAYNLLQIVAELIKETIRTPRVLGLLPWHVAENQITVIQQRLGPHGCNSPFILDNHTRFVYCRVCETVYSLVVDHKSVYKQIYDSCLRNASTDLLTGLPYCRHNKVNHRGACTDIPLSYITMIGARIVCDGRAIQHCAGVRPDGVHCGALMVIDEESSKENRFGHLCKQCIDAQRKQVLKEWHEWSDARTTVCDLCGKPASNEKTSYIFPFGLITCQNHHKLKLQEDTEQYMYHTREPTREGLMQIWAQHQTNAHREYRDRTASQNKHQLNKSRRQTRMRK
jgi:hypothetical protein